jgi:putative transposase
LIDRPNQVWAMDITYIPMARGFMYLAAVVDWFSRRVANLASQIQLASTSWRHKATNTHQPT